MGRLYRHSSSPAILIVTILKWYVKTSHSYKYQLVSLTSFKQLKAYLNEFHPSMIGLTGTYDEIKAVCRRYRVYFSTPRDLKEGMDYLVDHSIYFYLMGEH